MLRTNAPELWVNEAVFEVLHPLRADQQVSQASDVPYREAAEAWFSEPDAFGLSTEQASRLVRELTDAEGRPLRIEVLRGRKMPTLVFVDHESPQTRSALAQRVAERLAAKGVATR